MIVVLAGSAIAGAVAAWATRAERRSAERHADELAARLLWNPCRGLRPGSGMVIEGEVLAGAAPVASVLPAGRREVTAEETCPGQLVRHEDGHLTCQGGRADCWPEIPEHRPRYAHDQAPIACRTHAHGCGECLLLGTAS